MLHVWDLGVKEYGETLKIQRSLRERRLTEAGADILLLVEHPPTFTKGRRWMESEFVVPLDSLQDRGFAVHEVERGGGITYHGPGQLVGYPIFSLRALKLGIPEFISTLEQSVIDYLEQLRLAAHRQHGFPGVWVGERKIAAVGVHLKRWVSMHGFALNMDPDLDPFDSIIPCGLPGLQVTSVSQEAGCVPPMDETKRGLTEHVRKLFGYTDISWGRSEIF
ncbi:lipoyl(octanoyl) transferase LipB [Dehalococcoidia bacterium]|nr:lipoyl(octanoyl) transferase LipB [Dehalococcoidia bacterium]